MPVMLLNLFGTTVRSIYLANICKSGVGGGVF